MTKPKSRLTICGHTYTVEYIHDLHHHAGESTGYVNFHSQEIGIDDDISEEATKDTLIHEVLETINYHLEVGLEHHQITALACELAQVVTITP